MNRFIDLKNMRDKYTFLETDEKIMENMKIVGEDFSLQKDCRQDIENGIIIAGATSISKFMDIDGSIVDMPDEEIERRLLLNLNIAYKEEGIEECYDKGYVSSFEINGEKYFKLITYCKKIY